MANSTKKYEVTLLPSNQSAAKPTYYRGGLKFYANESQVLELTKEEVEVFKNDPRLQVKSSSDKGKGVKSEEATVRQDVPSDVTAEASEEESSNEVKDSEDTTSDEEKEVGGDPEEVPEVVEENPTDKVKSLTEKEQLQLNRAKLDEYAKENGVENPESYETKKEVVEAIAEATK